MQDISIHICFAKAVIFHAERLGISTEHLLQKSRIPARLLDEPNARISAIQYADLQKITMWEMNDELLGYDDLPMKTGSWIAACHWAIHANSIGQAIKRLAHFYSFMERGMRLEPVVHNDILTITIAPWRQKSLPPYPYEAFLFSFHRLLCWLAAEMIPIKLTSLPYPKPDHSDEYRAMLLASPLRFQHTDCQLQFDTAILHKPVKRSTEEMKRFIRNPLLFMMVDIHNTNSWSARTREAIGMDIRTMPSFNEIARRLDIHPKKLSRQLNAEGISYSELKAQLRRDISIFYLTKKGFSVDDVAIKTGFSEASSFIRAFKSWTGVTPYTYRKYTS